MIITRSPLRVSFAGGGTDLPQFYEKYGPGMVVSTSIDKYVYVSVSRKFDKKVSVRYRDHEMKDTVRELKHVLIRETLLHFGIEDNIELVISSDVPAKGSGLGASSAMISALCLALSLLTDKYDYTRLGYGIAGKRELAEIACDIEINKCGSPIGKQDQYASVVGGFNQFIFNKDGKVDINKYERDRDDDFVKELEDQSMLFYMNIEHTYYDSKLHKDMIDKMFAPRILYDQAEQMDQKEKIHTLQRDNAIGLWDNMEYGNIERFQDHVNENWRLKRQVHPDISSEVIDQVIARAYMSGATAAKVCGAGGGGFLYLVVPPSMQETVRNELKELPELKFKFDQKGTECIFKEYQNEKIRHEA